MKPPDPRSTPGSSIIRYPGGAVVQVVSGSAASGDALVVELVPATIELHRDRIVAVAGDLEWMWIISDLCGLHHGADEPWTILDVPGVDDHGIALAAEHVVDFRDRLAAVSEHHHEAETAATSTKAHEVEEVDDIESAIDEIELIGEGVASSDDGVDSPGEEIDLSDLPPPSVAVDIEPEVDLSTLPPPPARAVVDDAVVETPVPVAATVAFTERDEVRPADVVVDPASLADLDAREISAWFGTHHVLDRVSLDMPPGQVTALIGPSGCGKSTFLRILNRMHEMVPSASLAGEVLLDGEDIYSPQRKLIDARRQIGMVFQKPNPFPAMSIYDNVVASYRLTGTRISSSEKDAVVESCLTKAGLWTEVKDRLRSPGGGLSGGQQQRLCIARALAIRPRVLLMDEPCSALDPTSTRRIEETIIELGSEVTIVIVTHNMQQAARVSDQCAFFLAEQGTPGVIVEHGPTTAMFEHPQDPRTNDYVNGRFG